VTKTGIWLHESEFLGASLDGLFFDDNSSYCIEDKCPHNFRNKDLKITFTNLNDYIINFVTNKNDFVLNSVHQYFDQIQGQTHITKISYFITFLPSKFDSIYFKRF